MVMFNFSTMNGVSLLLALLSGLETALPGQSALVKNSLKVLTAWERISRVGTYSGDSNLDQIGGE